jgi:hybrid cluster-associated redox disulfide protein
MAFTDMFKNTPEPATTEALVDSSMLISDILQKYPQAAALLMQCGMGCVSCPSSLMESLAEACMVHGLNTDEVVQYLNEELALA